MSSKRFLLGIRGKLVIIFILIKVIPLVLLAWIAWKDVDFLGKDVSKQTTEMTKDMQNVVTAVGDNVIKDSISALDSRSREAIERMTTDTAKAVADFLYQRDEDIRHAAGMEITEESFKHFLSTHTQFVTEHGEWILSPDRSSWISGQEAQEKHVIVTAQSEDNKEFHYRVPEKSGQSVKRPLYLEMTFVNPDGMEKCKVTTGSLLPSELRDVSKRENTWCRAETYFGHLKDLKPGEIYVSDVIGPYIGSKIIGTYTPGAAEKKGIAFEPEKAAYTGKENPVGKRFQGLIRWATPVEKNGNIIGYITLALDHTHIMEFTDHILPTEERYTAVSDASTGNYAFMFNNNSQCISHPRDYYIVGYEPETGEPVPFWMDQEMYNQWKESGQKFSEFIKQVPFFHEQSFKKKPALEQMQAGTLGLDVRFLNFTPQGIDWHSLTQYGGSGSFVNLWSGLWKLYTIAAIPYYTGQYGSSLRGFGYTAMCANVDEFHRPALEAKEHIDKIVKDYETEIRKKQQTVDDMIISNIRRTTKNLLCYTLIMILIVMGIAVWMASFITGRIKNMICGIQRFQEGELDFRLKMNPSDETGLLACAFDTMADRIEESYRKSEDFIGKLKKAEEKYRSIFENAIEGIYQSSIDGRFLSANPALASILGYDSPDDLMQNVTNIGEQLYVNTECRKKLFRMIKEHGMVAGFETQFYRKDKSIIWVSLNTRPVFDENGKLLYVEGMLEDITQRKEKEELEKIYKTRLEKEIEQRRELEHIISQSPVIVFLWKNAPGWPVEYVSESVSQFGYTADDFVSGRVTYSSIVFPDDLSRVGKEVEQFSREKRAEFEHQYRIVTRSGEVRWTEDKTWIRYDENGNITHYQGIIIDATLRREKEDAERERAVAEESEQRFFQIIDFLPDATFVIDNGGKVIFWNKEIEEMTGVKSENMTGRGNYEYAIPFYGERRPILIDLVNLSAEEIEEKYSHITRQSNMLFAEAYIPNLRGREIYLWGVAASLYDSEGNVIGAIESIRDITDRKYMEENLKQAKDAAESANQAKSAFLATMSHEIRTPMNGVIGMTGLLLSSDLTKDQRMFAENIRNSGESLLTIINDILDFSKIEAGQLELENVPFTLRECAESALDLVAVKAYEKGIDLGLMADSDLPAAVMGDETRVRQILLNLLSNAVKFTHKGQVIVSVSGSRLPAEAVWEIFFAVKDSGIGIPANRMDRLFKSFSQVDSSTTRKYGGTGLGLVISRRLTEMMGGTMRLESTEGIGTTFHFSIRAQAAEMAKPVYLNPEQPCLTGKQVLIVDDNAVNREILVRQTSAWGMGPEAVSSGAEALEAAGSGKQFDLAILDMQMPEMDGLELAEKLHRQKGTENLPLMMMSSAGQTEKESGCTEFAAWLLKPVKASQLYNAMTEVFAGDSSAIAGKEKDGESESEYDSQVGKRHPLRILVAEDNSINQQLALLTLERLGYIADIAGNGLEATKQIRREFPPDRQPRIIAMTANALQGDREMCLNAGMDDYVSKPFKVKELVRALSQCTSRVRENKTEGTPQSTDSVTQGNAVRQSENPVSPAELDPQALKNLKAMLGKKAAVMLPKLIDDFFRDAVKMQEQARQAMEQGKTEDLRRAVHTLKSNAKNFGATALAQLCQETESIAKTGSNDVSCLLDQIKSEYPKVRAALAMVSKSGKTDD